MTLCWGAWRVGVMQERVGLAASLVSDMPPPSVELTLIAVMLRTHLLTLKPKARREYLRGLMRTMEDFEADANVVRLRGREHDAAVALTRRQSVAWVRAAMGAFFIADSERV